MFKGKGKAVVGALLAGLAAAGTALADSHFTGLEVVTTISAVVGTYSGVYWTTNKP